MPVKILMQVQSSWPPKGNSLHKNMSYDVQIDKIGPSFLYSSPFYATHKSYALQYFLINQTALKVPLLTVTSTYPRNTCSLDPPNSEQA